MISRYEQFSGSVAALNRYIQKIEREEMEKYGYKGSFAQYLVVMARRPEGLTSTQLCEACDKDKAAVSRAVGEMEEKGLIYRESVGESMYRAKLCLTEEGRSAAQYVCRRAEAAVAAAGQGLTEENRQVFYTTMELIAKNLQSYCKENAAKKKI